MAEALRLRHLPSFVVLCSLVLILSLARHMAHFPCSFSCKKTHAFSNSIQKQPPISKYIKHINVATPFRRHRFLVLFLKQEEMSFEDLESGRSMYVQGGSGSWERQTKQAITNLSASDNRQSIVAGVFQINTALTNFQRLAETLGTPKDTLQLRHKLHSTRQQIGELIKGTSANLKQAIESNRHSQSSATKKIADAKLAKDFQSVLKKFQKAQQLAAQREAAYTPSIPREIISSRSREIQISSSVNTESSSILLESKRQDIIQLEHEIVFNGAIIEEREQGIIEIQQQIGELNEMFKDLALLVHEQGTMLDDISSNIDSSHDATAQAAKQLTKASKIQQCNSSMSCLLLVIFGVILLIIIVLVLA